ncbi:MAG: hypothetical protein AB7E82_15090 [Cyclobacteriaceae bacterium]
MRLYLLPLILLIATMQVIAQPSARKSASKRKGNTSQFDKFLEKQWWIGLKAGINMAEALPTARYAVLTPTNYNPSLTDKTYDGFRKMGSQATFEVTFYVKGISFSLQPTYRHNRFTYENNFEWENPENSVERLVLKYEQEQKVGYADLPLIIKYDIAGNKLRPYVQGGVFYSLLVSANKSVEITGTDFGSGGTNEFSSQPVVVGAKDLFHTSYWGLLAGAGLNYNQGNVRFIFDASYRLGMSNITHTQNRFNNDRLSGIGDAQDDMKLNNLVFSFGCLFPLRFLSSSFKALDR